MGKEEDIREVEGGESGFVADRDKVEEEWREEPISRDSRKVPEFDLCDFETLIKRVTL